MNTETRHLNMIEVLVYGPGEHTFDPAEWPDATHMTGRLIAGDAEDGTRGETVVIALERLRGPIPLVVGKGGGGAQDGSVTLVLYGPAATDCP